jgi:glycosyltransferase involved in cell wall biosynthesis
VKKSIKFYIQLVCNKIFISRFKKFFNEEEYLKINPDVLKAIKRKEFKNAWEHFVLFGFDEFKKGRRKFHSGFKSFSLESYKNFVKKSNLKLDFFIYFCLKLISYKRKKKKIEKSKNYQYQEPKKSKDIEKEIKSFKKKPLISIIMPVYNVDIKWLDLAIKSIEKQWYENWELCIADDASTKEETKEYLKKIKNPKIKIKFLEKNQGISGASNEALKLAKGEYIVLMDNDDEISPDALYEVVKVINEKDAEFIYSDEDKIETDGIYTEPHFKPDFSPDMFLSQNYISHLAVIRKDLVEKVGGWEIGVEGSQDYDLYLKVLENTDKIYHIPKVLYHWRKVPGSTAANFNDKSYAWEAGRVALENALKRRGIKGKAKKGLLPGTYKIEYEIKGEPLVSIIIPFKDKPELLKSCVESILENTTYKNYEIIGISNNSKEEKIFEMMEYLQKKDKRIRFYEYNIPFNYSKINNYAVKNYARGEHIVFMNNDIEIITPRWIEEILMFSQREDVGAVGPKLYYEDDTIQHAGVILGIGGVAGHSHKYMKKDKTGYFARPHIIQNISAVTAALMMVKKKVFEEVEGFDEENLKVAFNDVDLCLKIREKGYLNVYTPYCEAYHHESKSRGTEDTPEKQRRFQKEVIDMKKRWGKLLKNDPYYNPKLTLEKEDFSLIGGKNYE